MKVLALVPSQKGHSPGQRGSIELWETVLNAAGIKLDFAPFETQKLRTILYANGRSLEKAIEMFRGYAQRLRIVNRLDEYDAVFVYREAALLGPAFLERLIARKKPIIYQLDDPLFVPYKSPSNGYLSYLKFFGKIKEIIKISSAVIVNSTHISEYAADFNRNIWQIPSIVDTAQFSRIRKPAQRRICIGWSGSPTTLKNLKMIEKPLAEISKQRSCDIHFIGGTTDELNLNEVDCTAQRWQAETEVADLRKLDIGLVPLPMNPWNPYKFIMKTAQYMALGIVPVGTPIASNPEVIKHGENGFLAANDDDWIKYLTILANDGPLREKMADAAERDAEMHYSLAANREKIVAAFKSVLNNDGKR